MASKYALVERERRFLAVGIPDEPPSAVRTITDLYVAGTRLRLRRVETKVGDQLGVEFKLTQKVPDPLAAGGRRGEITTIYLDESEYERLSALPGDRLTKTRLSLPPMGVDVFEGALNGLVVAEVEFTDDESMNSFVPPPWCGPEVTDDPDLTGASLAALSRSPDRAQECVADWLAFPR